MNNPLVSIIICCYNRAHLLERTLESVFAQDYDPVEIIAVDDGSTDDTKDVLRKYEKINYIRQENQGVAVARNTGCKAAKGEFIAFQDDDDIMPANRITILYDALCQYPDAPFAMGDWACIDNEDILTGENSNFQFKLGLNKKEICLIEDGYQAVMSSRISPVPHTTLIRKNLGDSLNWFDTRFFHSCEDTDFFARCSMHGPIVYVPETVSHYRRADGSLCSSPNSLLVEISRILLIEKHLKMLNENHKNMNGPLQLKLFNALARIAFLTSAEGINPDNIQLSYVKKGISLLNIQRRLKYIVYTMLKLPIRNLIIKIKSL